MATNPPVSLLSAEWLNARLDNVADQAMEIIDRILFQGLLSSGYLPGERPLTQDDVQRMTQEQFLALYSSLDPAEQEELLGMTQLDNNG